MNDMQIVASDDLTSVATAQLRAKVRKNSQAVASLQVGFGVFGIRFVSVRFGPGTGVCL